MTLVELLVVILLLGITAALVLPALTPPRPAETDEATALLTRARRMAIRRGEPLRLRVDTDGVWALIVARDGSEVDAGRIQGRRDATTAEDGSARATLDLTIDVLGSCLPAPSARPDVRFDPLACAWEPSADRVAVGTGR